ncbi:MAG: mannose-1-phosphate guanylyltransferase [Candidatus Omnitrophica bacterium]|nr:mannose-1-phosphate guanylyltransferase [Candidatus Omnitrophota bacterium]
MIHAIILAGGWGRRLWPRSRRSRPKQLLCLGERHPAVHNLFNMIKSEIPKERIWVVGNKEYAVSLRRQFSTLPRKNFLLEPLAKNTAVAVGWASLMIKRIDPEAVTVVLASDHILGKKARFLRTIKLACRKAKESDVLVTIGIRPDRPEEGFGYLKIAQSSRLRQGFGGRAKLKAQKEKIFKVEKFIEKPKFSKAKKYVRSGKYLWNGGIFAWRVANILQAIKMYLPKLYSGLQRIEKVRGSSQYKNRLVKEYSRFQNVSITYGIMEKARNIYTVAADFPWADIGTWISLSQDASTRDEQGNIIQGLHKGIDTYDSLILGNNKHLIATIGVRDLIIVHTPTATLVCNKTKAQEVRELTKLLEKDKHLKKYL